MSWQHRDYGSVTDPVHKSHLQVITGDYACAKRFWYQRNASPTCDDGDSPVYTQLGTATHEVIARALTTAHRPSNTVKALQSELTAPLSHDDDLAMLVDRAMMVDGLLTRIRDRVKTVIGCELGFIAPFGGYWISGHIDLLYEPMDAPGTVAMCDWKTGASKPHEISLTHGWEAGIYSAALKYGVFLSSVGASRQTFETELIQIAQAAGGGALTPTFGVFPSLIHQVHLADYVPYKKAGSKHAHRPEDLEAFGYREPTQHKYKAGEQRGGAWMPVPLTPHDLTRFATRLKLVVGTVRMGRFLDQPGEQCTRCTYRGPCLTSGYTPLDEDQAKLTALMKLSKQLGMDTNT